MSETAAKTASEKVGDPSVSRVLVNALLQTLSPSDPERARSVLAQLLEAQQRGDTALCVPDATAAWLRGEAWVSDGEQPAPVVLHGNRVQFHIYWQAERWILEGLAPRVCSATKGTLPQKLVEAAQKQNIDPEKLAQIERALDQSLTLLTGGPGTGKTTTLAWLLAALLHEKPQMTLALAAPTGKAAQRMKEALDGAIPKLPLSAEQKAKLSGLAPTTLHRLLGIGTTPQPWHTADNPLPYDLVVVDEASMVDVLTLAKLINALRPETRLILMGDPHQLASVEAGNVLADLVRAFPAAHCQLTRSHRFNPVIGALADAVLQGDVAQACALVAETDGSVIQPVARRDLLAVCERGHEDYLAMLKGKNGAGYEAVADHARTLLKALQAFRVLTPLRHHYRWGVEALNARLIRHFKLKPLGRDHYVGQPILIQENDHTLELFNGDQGVILPVEGVPMAWFERGGQIRALPVSQLPAWESAFAMTVHKAQGAEFDEVLLALPEEDTPLLTRELVYTALTRAKKRFGLMGLEPFLEAVRHPTERMTGLGVNPPERS